jgi:hypothetical protein
MGAVLIDVGRRDLKLAVVAGVILDVAYLLQGPLFHTAGHIEAIALLCVTAMVVAVAMRRPTLELAGKRQFTTTAAPRTTDSLTPTAHFI